MTADSVKISTITVTVRDLVNGYTVTDRYNSTAYGGRLAFRPMFQGDYISTGMDQSIIRNILNGRPLGPMCWAKNPDGSGTYEIADGQERLLSICRYADGDFAADIKEFFNHTKEEQEAFLDYSFNVYICEGSVSGITDWLKTCYFPEGKKTSQELRNLFFRGDWLIYAVKWFGQRSCPAAKTGAGIVEGRASRMEILETALSWIADHDNCSIEEYMAAHREDNSCCELWHYYEKIINWVKTEFPGYRNLKGKPLGLYYNRYMRGECTVGEIKGRLC